VLTLLQNNPDKSGKVSIEFTNRADEVHVDMDEEQMRQVFTNLAVNACEAMVDGGCLRVKAGQEEPGTVAIAFGDEGPGIEEADVERLFEPFFTTKDGGTGLGLAIANRIVTAHGGSIEFKNKTGGGAEFTVVLPVGHDSNVAAKSRRRVGEKDSLPIAAT
jgi:signal transduction histidine kinase